MMDLRLGQMAHGLAWMELDFERLLSSIRYMYSSYN